jgi:peptide/nickel transport system ATP-binding protein
VSSDLLSVRDLAVSVRHDRGELPVLRGVELDVREGELVGLVGESGSGKSMTALTVMGLVATPQVRATGGTIELHGEDLLQSDRRRRRALWGSTMSMIFQEPMTALDPCFSIGTHLVETIRTHRGGGRAAARRAAAEALTQVRIPDPDRVLRQYPFELSGGMQQRVLIAMALAGSPKLLIADEPTTALDVTVEAQILDLLSDLRDTTGTAILLISHDLALVGEVCDRVYVMYAGTIVEQGPAARVLSEPHHPYTKALLESVPGMERTDARLPSIVGEPPAVGVELPPCPFEPRCAYAWDRCRQAPPALHWPTATHAAACHLLDAPAVRNGAG